MKINNKTKMIFALTITIIMLFSACSSSPAEEESEIPSDISAKSNVTSEVPENESIKVIDQAGREVELEKPAEKIVSVYFIPSYTLMSLGLQNKVVGIENKPESRPFYEKFGEDMKNQPQVGTRKEINLEEIIALEPDLVILPDGQQDGADQLSQVGIKSIIVNPENEKSYTEMLEIIGKLTGTEERVKVLKSFYKEKSDNLKKILDEKFKDTKHAMKTAYLSSGSSPLRGAAGGMFQSDILNISKIINVASETKGDHWADFSLEQIIEYNPELIFISAQPDFEIVEILEDDKWADITAVAETNVFIIPSNIDSWDTPSYASVMASYWMVSKAYPDIISSDEVVELSKEYYQLFFDYTVTEEDLGI